MTVSDRQIEMARAYGEKHGVDTAAVDLAGTHLWTSDRLAIALGILVGEVVPVDAVLALPRHECELAPASGYLAYATHEMEEMDKWEREYDPTGGYVAVADLLALFDVERGEGEDG